MTFWSSARLKQALPNIVPPPAKAFVEYGSIVLHVGVEVYVTPHVDVRDPSSQSKIQLSDKESFTIPAGQFAFLLTEESVAIPHNAIGFISIKARTKFRGLVNVSGFHVDPGYKGKLIFSVFNAGPAPILLEQGMELFTLWLADLDDQATLADARDKDGFTNIPVDVINSIPGEIYSLQTLSKKISELETSMKIHWVRLSLIAAGVLFLITLLLRTQIAHEFGNIQRVYHDAQTTRVIETPVGSTNATGAPGAPQSAPPTSGTVPGAPSEKPPAGKQ